MRPPVKPHFSGYTLVELIVVLVVIAMLAVLVLPYSRRIAPAKKDNEPEMLLFLKQQREVAVRTGKTVCILVSKDKLQAVPTGAEYRLHKEETLRMRHPEASPFLAQQTGACFQPDGGMTEADWVLGIDKFFYNIKFSPFSGEIAMTPQSQVQN